MLVYKSVSIFVILIEYIHILYKNRTYIVWNINKNGVHRSFCADHYTLDTVKIQVHVKPITIKPHE